MVDGQRLRFPAGSRARRLLALTMVTAVVLGHAWVAREFSLHTQGWRDAPPADPPVVSVVADLRPVDPPRRPPARSAPPPVEQPQASESPDDSLAITAPPTPAPPPAIQEATPPNAEAAAEPAPPAPNPQADAPAIDPWPPSTRVRYTLKGNFRGEFSGSAEVVWVRDGPRYQVRLEVVIGPRAAPLISRRVFSEGLLSASGLIPQRYDETTKVFLSRPRRTQLRFEPGAPGEAGSLVLQDGTRRPAPVGTQDSASQFVQLAWLLGTHPTPVKPGDRVSFPLALARRSDTWTYVVGDPMTVDTPAGPVEAIHTRPQREIDPLRRDLLAEVWFAPALRYLPVRMKVVADEETFADLIMDGLPELLAPENKPAEVKPGEVKPGETRPSTVSPA